jgi:hypothetical protein
MQSDDSLAKVETRERGRKEEGGGLARLGWAAGWCVSGFRGGGTGDFIREAGFTV